VAATSSNPAKAIACGALIVTPLEPTANSRLRLPTAGFMNEVLTACIQLDVDEGTVLYTVMPPTFTVNTSGGSYLVVNETHIFTLYGTPATIALVTSAVYNKILFPVAALMAMADRFFSALGKPLLGMSGLAYAPRAA